MKIKSYKATCKEMLLATVLHCKLSHNTVLDEAVLKQVSSNIARGNVGLVGKCNRGTYTVLSLDEKEQKETMEFSI